MNLPAPRPKSVLDKESIKLPKIPAIAEEVIHVFRPHQRVLEIGEMRKDEKRPPRVNREVARPNWLSVSGMQPVVIGDCAVRMAGLRLRHVRMGWRALSSEMP